MPCRCSDVDSGSSLVSTMRTLSPTSTRRIGPGICPLYAQPSTTLPSSTSHGITEAVSANSFVPSGAIVGASSPLPVPAVGAG